jgi:hypothetical protein
VDRRPNSKEQENLTNYYVRPASADDVEWLAPRLREADLQEIAAGTGEPALSVLTRGLTTSRPCLVGCVNDDPIVIFGVAPNSDNSGSIWMLATDAIVTHRRAYLSMCSSWLNTLNGLYPTLLCLADARNTVHHRLIKWAGFRYHGKIESHGVAQLPFLLFTRQLNV